MATNGGLPVEVHHHRYKGDDRAWVARLVALHEKYVFEREFVREERPSPGVYTFRLEPGWAYEFRNIRRDPGGEQESGFLIFDTAGHGGSVNRETAKEYVRQMIGAAGADPGDAVLTKVVPDTTALLPADPDPEAEAEADPEAAAAAAAVRAMMETLVEDHPQGDLLRGILTESLDKIDRALKAG